MWSFQVENSWKPLVISKGVFLIMTIWGIGGKKKKKKSGNLAVFKKFRKRVHNLALSFCLTESYETCSRHSSRIKKFQKKKKNMLANSSIQLKYTNHTRHHETPRRGESYLFPTHGRVRHFQFSFQ